MIEQQRAEFDRLWPLLKEAVLRYGDTHEKEHVWSRIETGHAQFWALPNAAIVTEVHTYETGMRESRGWLAGGDIREITAFIPRLEDLARKAGCRRVTITGRRGWSRALTGYKDLATIVVKEL
tara:strand:+ start:1520 stop:1888 length:369 start_codon:yes stop_codon:yes gene_type:complete